MIAGQLLLKMAFYLIAGVLLASITWSTIEHSRVTGDYILSVILLSMMFFIVGKFCVDRWRPEYGDGDFHPTRLWKTPRETTRAGLWLRVGFRTLASVVIYGVLASLLVLTTTARPSFMILLGTLFLLRAPHMYWSMRGRYEVDQEANCRRVLRYEGGSRMDRRAKWLTPIGMASLGVVIAAVGILAG